MSRIQKGMAALMGIAAASLIGWAVLEMVGVLDKGTANDTWTEFVSYTPPALLWTIIVFQVAVGILAIWSSGHYLETRSSRPKKKK